MLEDTLVKLEDLNTSLRAQRHDFMNHLQVVYGLMEMKEYPDAMKYIDRVYNDIQSINKFLKTSNPAVNALLQAKVLYAEKRGIDVRMNITTNLKELKIQPWEFCRVLGNLIDNAIYALQKKVGDRYILIELFEDLKKYGFRVINNGPEIPEELLEKIFDVGFSTKDEDGEGMGLAIVKKIIGDVGGSITVCSSKEKTFFEGILPR
jgi:sensor histidine kinase regulating citrate/malate metabolism